MSAGPVLEFFSEIRIAVQREIPLHPELCRQMTEAKVDTNDWGAVVAAVAAYIGIEVDGYFTGAEVDQLANILYWHLENRRPGKIIHHPIQSLTTIKETLQ